LNGGAFREMNECFKARERVVKEIGKPIIDYQAICIAKTIPGKDA